MRGRFRLILSDMIFSLLPSPFGRGAGGEGGYLDAFILCRLPVRKPSRGCEKAENFVQK